MELQRQRAEPFDDLGKQTLAVHGQRREQLTHHALGALDIAVPEVPPFLVGVAAKQIACIRHKAHRGAPLGAKQHRRKMTAGIINILCASQTTESASSIPASLARCCALTSKPPPWAASTCSQQPCARASVAISASGSNAPTAVELIGQIAELREDAKHVLSEKAIVRVDVLGYGKILPPRVSPLFIFPMNQLHAWVVSFQVAVVVEQDFVVRIFC